MKQKILENVKIIDILDKYNIPHNNKKLRCPFHGEDKHPSAFIYDTHFHCFTCQEHQDVIGFVQKYFNLNFKEAMQKINEDFNLNLDSNAKIDYNKIIEIETKRKQKKLMYERLENKFKELCDTKFDLKRKLKNIKKNLNLTNWELKEFCMSLIEDQIGKIEMELDLILDEMYKIKNS